MANNNRLSNAKRKLVRLSLQETADRLGISKDTVRTYEMRAIAKLRRSPLMQELWKYAQGVK